MKQFIKTTLFTIAAVMLFGRAVNAFAESEIGTSYLAKRVEQELMDDPSANPLQLHWTQAVIWPSDMNGFSKADLDNFEACNDDPMSQGTGSDISVGTCLLIIRTPDRVSETGEIFFHPNMGPITIYVQDEKRKYPPVSFTKVGEYQVGKNEAIWIMQAGKGIKQLLSTIDEKNAGSIEFMLSWYNQGENFRKQFVSDYFYEGKADDYRKHYYYEGGE